MDVDGPGDLSGLSDEQLQQLAQEVRELIINTIGEIGGHFGANLGTCELAVALMDPRARGPVLRLEAGALRRSHGTAGHAR